MSSLPTSWIGARLEDIAHVEMGQSPKSKFYNDQREGLPFFQGKAEFGPLYPTARKWCTQPTKIAEEGDILLSVRAPVGPTNVAAETCCIGRGLAAIRGEPAMSQEFLLYHFRNLEPWLKEQGTGTTFKAINGAFVRSLDIVLAPLNEQRRIADKLDAVLARVDACRERLDRVPAILKRFRQSVLAAATSGKLTEDWREERGLEFDWKDVTLAEIANIQGGVTKDSKKQSTEDEELPYLRVANVQRGYLDLSEIKTIRIPSRRLPQLLLEPGDILFNEGGDIDKLGRGWIWEGQIPRCSFQNHVFRARLKDRENQPKYISWWGNFRGLDYFLRAGKQTTNLASINKKMLSSLPIRLPTPEEQAEIVGRVEQLLEIEDRVEAQYGAARAYVEDLTPALLAKAFRGELVPQDPNDELASLLLERVLAARAETEAKPKRSKTPRRNRVAKLTSESLKTLVSEMPEDHFTFDELRARASTDYDSLRDAVFSLLADSDAGLRQDFDSEASEMRFVRTKS